MDPKSDTKSSKLLRKENRRENPRDPRKELAALREQLKEQEEANQALRESYRALEAKYNKKRDEESVKRTENQQLLKTIQELRLENAALTQKTVAVMAERVPLVAAVVMKSVYKKAANIPSRESAGQDTRIKKMRSLGHKFQDMGCEGQEKINEFIEMWSTVIEQRNDAAHKVTGDKVLEILPYCEERMRRVLEQAFRSLWEVSPSDWPNVTPEKKDREFRNCTDWELEKLG
ncbi:hypothetical protein B9Z19DRAFT_1123867 [Tuber borchii]|uniref:Uncharacterized protein n=1 Tax=Tuber borchii TaxID=42251 RepID=A0A2T6ZXQ5_TUBBO|nr:hypothetical protein B9Z19DRAFT_1123867 [Tuber borchii]